jgi:hypothetical protein
MMIALLVSVGALLLVAGGVARHIWLQRSRLHSSPDAGPTSKGSSVAIDAADEVDHEVEI